MSGVDDAPIVERASEQRWPAPGEPACVVCGKYGEYICDKTEKDVCSMECKHRNLSIYNSRHAQAERAVGCPGEISPPASQCPALCLSSQQVDAIRKELQLTVQGDNVPPPFVEFSDAGALLPEKLVDNMCSANILTPTPVQMQALPLVLGGRHLLASAPPGSGKTAAFLLPLLARIALDGRDGGSPRVLILASTRELATQLEEHTKVLAKGLPNIRTALVVGGLPLKPQIYRLQTAAEVVIATPGKLSIILQEHITDADFFAEVLAVVLDEVDRVLHKEFESQVIPIVERLPDGVQKLMFSATLDEGVKDIAASLLTDPVTMTVGQVNALSTSVTQTVIWVEEAAKKNHLFALLNDAKHYKPPLLIFVERQQGADLLADAIVKKCNLTACAIHGGLDQATRYRLVGQFTAGQFPILVSTPLLGRGIDWPHVKLVINFDMPGKVVEFVHQTGRAGRMGSAGRAITFINHSSSRLFPELKRLLGDATRLPQQLTNALRATGRPASARAADSSAPALAEPASKRKPDVTARNLLDMLKGVHGKSKKR